MLSMMPTRVSFGPVVDQKSKPLTARGVALPPKVPERQPSSQVEPQVAGVELLISTPLRS